MSNTFIIDQHWDEVGKFLRNNLKDPSPIIADQAFRAFKIRTVDPINENILGEDFSTFVCHKDTNLSPALIEFLESSFKPVFANEVFVIFSKNKKISELKDSIHLTSYKNKLRMMRSMTADIGSRLIGQRNSVYIGQNRVLSKTIFNHKIFLDSRDLSLTPHIIMDGYWEKWISDVFLSLIDEDSHVIDIGANIGYYSLLAASKIGTKGKLTSFEANPDVAKILFDNIQINGFGEKCKVVQKAVHSDNGQVEFKVFEKFLGSSSIYATKETAENFNDKLTSITVETVTLDTFFPPGERIDLIKIDAEGAEPYILKGASRIFSENPNIKLIMEFSPGIINVAYDSTEKFFAELEEMGFRMFLIDHDSSLKQVSHGALHTLGHCDVLLKRI